MNLNQKKNMFLPVKTNTTTDEDVKPQQNKKIEALMKKESTKDHISNPEYISELLKENGFSTVSDVN